MDFLFAPAPSQSPRLNARPNSKEPRSSQPPKDGHIVSTTHDGINELQGEALRLAQKLRGGVLRIPDLTKVFASWPRGANKHEERLTQRLNSLLESIITNKRKLNGLKKADFARLTSLWYPDAEWDELEVVAAYTAWVFIWDDEIDAGGTEVSENPDKAQAYFSLSRNYIRTRLGLIKGSNSQLSTTEEAYPNLRLFGLVGDGMRTVTDSLQRHRFYRELDEYMEGVKTEHDFRMPGIMPTVAQYLESRRGAVGCRPQLALADYSLKVRLPEAIMESEAMRSLWRETEMLCIIINDIYSCRKEFAEGSLMNIVPVLYHNLPREGQTLDATTDAFMALLYKAIEGFESAAEQLDSMVRGDDKLQSDTTAFVRWHRCLITGGIYWCLETQRYCMSELIQEGGSVSVWF